MTIDSMPLWEILVPHRMGEHDKTDPNIPKPNQVIHLAYHQAWDDFVRSQTGGLTILRASNGQWLDNQGKLYKEIMIPVRIACSEETIKIIAKHSMNYYKQKAIFVTLISEKTMIFHEE